MPKDYPCRGSRADGGRAEVDGESAQKMAGRAPLTLSKLWQATRGVIVLTAVSRCSSASFDSTSSTLDDTGMDGVSTASDAPYAENSDAVDSASSARSCASNTDCAPGIEYCAMCPSDSTGTCTKLPAASTEFLPVCTCLGMTVWNAHYAATLSLTRGLPVKQYARCDPTVRALCTRDAECPGSEFSGATVKCVGEISEAQCRETGSRGGCWIIPSAATCGAGTVAKQTVQTCGGATVSKCAYFCEQAKMAARFYASACTP